MRITYRISIKARTLSEAIPLVSPREGTIIGQPVIIRFGGAGTELKNLIAKFGLQPGLNCKCGQHIREMDQNGPEWCEANIDTIAGWLREEAERARLPFTEIGAKLLTKRAISNAKKKQQKDQDMTVRLVVEIDTDDVYDAITRTKPAEGKVEAASAEPTRTPPEAQGGKAKPA